MNSKNIIFWITMFIAIILIVLTSVIYMSTQKAQAISFIPEIKEVYTNPYLVSWCMENNCENSGESILEYDKNLLDELEWENTKINRKFINIEDKDQFGSIDRWQDISITGKGDCEDFVIHKRKIFSEKYNIPTSAMRIAIVRTSHNIIHAVLIVRTTKGDYIFDNLVDYVSKYPLSTHKFLYMTGSNSLLETYTTFK